MSVDQPSTAASSQFLTLWQNSEARAGFEQPGTTADRKRDSEIQLNRSNIWSNFSALSSSDQAQLMSKLSTNWPFGNERRALTWPIHAGLLTNCITSALIATRINSDMFLFNPKASFLESVRKCPKSPFVFGIYSSGVTYYVMYQSLITPKVFNEETPCPSCLVINSIAIGLTTGIAMPMLATPYLAHYVLMQRETKGKYPEIKNMLEFLTLGWEGSRAARSILAPIVAIQMIVSFTSMYALLWGRQRMFSTLEYDSDLAKTLISDAHQSTSLKQKITDFLLKIPFVSGIIETAPEKERVI